MVITTRQPRREQQKAERCWLLVGQRKGQFWLGRRVRPTVGSIAEVEFDPHWAISREETRGDLIGFYHTHPAGSHEPSQRDVRTMHAWVGAFAKPLLCLIQVSHGLHAFRFDDYEQDGLGAGVPEVSTWRCRRL